MSDDDDNFDGDYLEGADDFLDDLEDDAIVESHCYFHLYFSTHAQKPVFDDSSLREELQHELERICQKLLCLSQAISVWDDHVHVAFRLHQELSLDGLVNRLKGDSTTWLKHHAPELSEPIWQESYAAYTIGGSEVGELRHYLEEESQRHLIESYEDEFRRLCAKNGIEIDEPDCWA